MNSSTSEVNSPLTVGDHMPRTYSSPLHGRRGLAGVSSPVGHGISCAVTAVTTADRLATATRYFPTTDDDFVPMGDNEALQATSCAALQAEGDEPYPIITHPGGVYRVQPFESAPMRVTQAPDAAKHIAAEEVLALTDLDPFEGQSSYAPNDGMAHATVHDTSHSMGIIGALQDSDSICMNPQSDSEDQDLPR